MKDTEEALARVLAGIRTVEVPVELEEGVLRAVREREPFGEKARFSGRLFGGVCLPTHRSWVFAGGSAAVLAMLLVCAAVYQFGDRFEAAQPKVAVKAVVPTAPVRMARVEPVTVEGSRKVPPRSTVLRERGMRSVEAKSLAGSLSVSYSAPPMPLTEQERLLLRVAHKGDPVEMAMLDGVRWRGELAEGRAEFQRFFKPVAPVTTIGEELTATSTATGASK